MPVLAQQESFYRVLRRATDPDPDRRFASASEMAEQLTGVLREVLSAADGKPRPAFSALFSPELHPIGVEATVGDGTPDRASTGPRRATGTAQPGPRNPGAYPAAHAAPRWPRSWPGCRCRRWTPPTRRPATWPR